MSNNLIEPFFSMSNDPKEYFHTFSESIMNFSPSLGLDNIGSAPASGNIPGQQYEVSITHSQMHTHSGLSDIFKCNGETHFDDYHNEYSNICSPCIIDGMCWHADYSRYIHTGHSVDVCLN